MEGWDKGVLRRQQLTKIEEKGIIEDKGWVNIGPKKEGVHDVWKEAGEENRVSAYKKQLQL